MVSVEVRYRLMVDEVGNWFVRWLCGSSWLLVYGPAGSEAQAREWVDSAATQQL